MKFSTCLIACLKDMLDWIRDLKSHTSLMLPTGIVSHGTANSLADLPLREGVEIPFSPVVICTWRTSTCIDDMPTLCNTQFCAFINYGEI